MVSCKLAVRLPVTCPSPLLSLYPHTLTPKNSEKFSLIFLSHDMLPPVSSSSLLFVFLAVEVVGIVRRWQTIDHWAHLGGYLTGIAGAYWLKHRIKQRALTSGGSDGGGGRVGYSDGDGKTRRRGLVGLLSGGGGDGVRGGLERSK